MSEARLVTTFYCVNREGHPGRHSGWVNGEWSVTDQPEGEVRHMPAAAPAEAYNGPTDDDMAHWHEGFAAAPAEAYNGPTDDDMAHWHEGFAAAPAEGPPHRNTRIPPDLSDDPEGEHCYDCGKAVGVVWTAPDAMWAEVTDRADGGGLLCVRCFDRRAEQRGQPLRWVPQPLAAPRDCPTCGAPAVPSVGGEWVSRWYSLQRAEAAAGTALDVDVCSAAFRAAVKEVFEAPGEWGPAQGYYAGDIDHFIDMLDARLRGGDRD